MHHVSLITQRALLFGGLFLLTSMALGCAARHIDEYEPRERAYSFPVDISQDEQAREAGALWDRRSEANTLFADLRAMRPGDILTIRVEEFANAQRGANTRLTRQSELNAEVSAFLTLMERLREVAPELGDQLVGTSTTSLFDASGSTGRSERLEATVPGIIKQMLGNGHVFVEGHRVVLVNNEEHHFYISGVARLQDIDESNAISSARLADAEIEFTGQGDLSMQQRQGVFGRIWSIIWPF